MQTTIIYVKFGKKFESELRIGLPYEEIPVKLQKPIEKRRKILKNREKVYIT